MKSCRLENFDKYRAEWHELWAELDECGHNCPRYYSCDNVSIMNNRLEELEESGARDDEKH